MSAVGMGLTTVALIEIMPYMESLVGVTRAGRCIISLEFTTVCICNHIIGILLHPASLNDTNKPEPLSTCLS